MCKREEIAPRTPEAEKTHKEFLKRCGVELKRIEIREGMSKFIKLVGNKPDVYTPKMCAEDLMEYLDAQGVVIQVDRKLPVLLVDAGKAQTVRDTKCAMLEANFVAVERLIE